MKRVMGPLLLALVTSMTFSVCTAQPAPITAEATPKPYIPFEPLIGEWTTGAPGKQPMLIQRFSWGPNRASIVYSVWRLDGEGRRHLHFEGPMVWNTATKKLDFLFIVEPGSLEQEKGEISLSSDNEIVRDIVLTASTGKQSIFRQTLRSTGERTATTSLMRKTATGWEPTFPDSEALVMNRVADNQFPS